MGGDYEIQRIKIRCLLLHSQKSFGLMELRRERLGRS